MHGPENAIELFHGYTYSAHPLACAAASAVLDIYKNEALFERSAELSPYWEQGVHSLKGLPNVTDIRNLGLACGIDLAPEGAVGTRGFKAFAKAFELGLMVRQSGDAIAMSPPLVIEKSPDRRDHRHHRARRSKRSPSGGCSRFRAISPGWSANWPRWRMSPSRAA